MNQQAIDALPSVVIKGEVDENAVHKYAELFEAHYSFTAPGAREMRNKIVKKLLDGLTIKQLPIAVMELTFYLVHAHGGGKGHCISLLENALKDYEKNKL